jgi:cell division protein FtsI/penicillin-binding protein 2
MKMLEQMSRRKFLGRLTRFVLGWFVLQLTNPISVDAKKSRALLYKLPKGVSIAWKVQKISQSGAQMMAGDVNNPMPLGSVMKLFTAAVLLETKMVHRDTLFECRGTTRIPGFKQSVHCLKPHGKINLTQALGYSCNGYFVQASAKLPFEQWRDSLLKWGVPVQEESSKFPTYPSANHYIGLTPSVLMTPLTLLPLIEELAFGKGWAKMISPKIKRVLVDGIILAAREGTGKYLPSLKQGQMALKTGTVPYQKHFQSWAVGFFPANQPEIVFVLQDQRGSSQDKAVGSLKQWLLKTFPVYF